MVAETEIGKTVDVGVWRKGKLEQVSVTLGQLEKAEETGMLGDKDGKGDDKKDTPKTPSTDLGSLGLGLAPLTDKDRDTYGLGKQIAGVLITDVKPDGAAAEKGLAAGDLIVEVDQQDVAAPQDVLDKVAAAQKAGHTSVLFFVARKQDLRFVAIKLKKDK